jgi:hypothetical protein
MASSACKLATCSAWQMHDEQLADNFSKHDSRLRALHSSSHLQCRISSLEYISHSSTSQNIEHLKVSVPHWSCNSSIILFQAIDFRALLKGSQHAKKG